MNTSLKLIALIIAAGSPVVAFAENAGLHIPAAFNAESAIGLFVASIIGLLLFSDYARTSRRLTITAAPVIVPGANAFVTKPAAKSECLAA